MKYHRYMKTPLYKCIAYEGISLSRLAIEIGSSDSTLSRLQRGVSKKTSGEACYRLLERYKKYGLTLEHLIYPDRFPDFVINK